MSFIFNHSTTVISNESPGQDSAILCYAVRSFLICVVVNSALSHVYVIYYIQTIVFEYKYKYLYWCLCLCGNLFTEHSIKWVGCNSNDS